MGAPQKAKGLTRVRTEIATGEPVVRMMLAPGKRRFVWAVKEGSGYRIVADQATRLG